MTDALLSNENGFVKCTDWKPISKNVDLTCNMTFVYPFLMFYLFCNDNIETFSLNGQALENNSNPINIKCLSKRFDKAFDTINDGR